MDYGYIRYSHSTQERGSSVDRQEKLIFDRCPNMKKENIFIDKGVSSFRGANLAEGSQWAELMKVAKAGSTIYVEQIDRLTRAGIDKAQELFRDVRRAGINIVTTADNKLYEGGKETNAEEGIRIIFAADLGRAESATKSRRVRESYTKRNADAANPDIKVKIKIPLASWLEYENGQYKLNARAETVKLIFQWCIDGMGAGLIAKELNSLGTKPFRLDKKKKKEKEEGEEKEEEVKLWGAASVFVILTNKATYGTFVPNAWKAREARRLGEVYENTANEIAGYFPNVITEETFWQAQEALRIRRNTKVTRQTKIAPFNLLQGIGTCACGSRLHVMAKGRNKERYLVCANKIRNKSGCTAGNIREDVAERVFKELLTKINVVELLENKKPDIDILSIETELSKVRASHDGAVKDLNENGYNSTLGAYIRTTEQEIGVLEAKLTSAKEASLQAVMLLEDKQWLMEHIKLETREQRYRANLLLKKLNITVGMWRDTKTNRVAFYALGVMAYLLESDGTLREVALNREAKERYDNHITGNKGKDIYFEANVMNLLVPRQEIEQGQTFGSLHDLCSHVYKLD